MREFGTILQVVSQNHETKLTDNGDLMPKKNDHELK